MSAGASFLEIFKAAVPLFAVVLTAVLSGYIIPQITRGWQEYQKELELKMSLVEAINDTIVRFVLAMQLAERKASTQEEFKQAYVNWELQRAILVSRLRAYFRSPSLGDEFDKFTQAITDFYALAGINNPEYRTKQITKLKEYFGETATDWQKLGDQEMRSNQWFEWFFSWWQLREQILVQKDALVHSLMGAPLYVGGSRR